MSNGGSASVRSLPANHPLNGSDAFVIRVRGGGRRYKFTARTGRSFDSAIYPCAFTTKPGEWEEHPQVVGEGARSLLGAGSRVEAERRRPRRPVEV